MVCVERLGMKLVFVPHVGTWSRSAMYRGEEAHNSRLCYARLIFVVKSDWCG